jgi:hypothetical protein
LIFAPCSLRQCGGGLWEITRPFFTVREKARLIFPTLQLEILMEYLALASVMPFTAGVTQGGGWRLNVAWTDALPGVPKR